MKQGVKMKKKIFITFALATFLISGHIYIKQKQEKNWNYFFSNNQNIFLNNSFDSLIDFFSLYYDFFNILGAKKQTSEIWKYHACIFKDEILKKNRYKFIFNQKKLKNLIETSCKHDVYTFEDRKIYPHFWYLCENKEKCEYIILKTDTHILTQDKKVYQKIAEKKFKQIDYNLFIQTYLKTDPKINPLFVGFNETGIGNSLFQYWGAFAYAKKWGQTIIPLRHKPIFDIFSTLQSEPKGIQPLSLKNFRFILAKNNIDFTTENLIIAQNSLRYENLIGYEDFIRKNSKFKHELTKKNKNFIQNLNKDNAVAVHIRRGDFLSHGTAILDMTYYNNAISCIKKNIQDPHFYIFSDDITWAKNNFNIGFPTTFIDWNTKDYEDLQLMTYFKNFIIANSTFSWWGAFLSTEENKLVLTPKHGFYKSEKPDRPLEKGWILIPEN